MSSEQELKCVFCSDTFSQKEDLQIHFRKHADPNFNQKKLKGRAQDEADASTEKPRDQVETVECDVCPEVFTTISKAITHKHKMHPDHDTKYFCPWCGKLFTMKHLYKKHTQATHSDKTESDEKKALFHCDSCDVDFHIPGAMVYHNKFYHRQDDLPILGHSKKLKMILEELVQIYYCPFCGEEHDNKVNLHKHINEDHSSENQSPEDVFRCPLCDAIFYYLDAYELHLTYHSNEDLYTERNALMDEITDFSLETVQPLQEKVESAEPNNEGHSEAMGIEDLLELTMNESGDQIRKSKKHKKHKKSKKAAITLDEFLNMNKDVFGEGIDFQGIEEVPTQVIAKRFKTKKAVPAAHMSPDLVKLKRQGIVVKKQSTKIGKSLAKNNVALKSAMKSQKTINPTSQIKSTALTSTDDVLSKLLNQGSQIKIVKKSNQDKEEPIQQKEDKPLESGVENNGDTLSNVTNTEGTNTEASTENINIKSPEIDNVKMKSLAASPNADSPSLISDNKGVSQNSDEDSNNSDKYNDVMSENHDLSEKTSTDNLNSLQNNSNITLKSSKQNALPTKEDNDEVETATKTKEINAYDSTEKNNSPPENSSLSALKHLSHLITVKSVSNKAIPLSHGTTGSSNKAIPLSAGIPVTTNKAIPLPSVPIVSSNKAIPLHSGPTVNSNKAIPLHSGSTVSSNKAIPLPSGTMVSSNKAVPLSYDNHNNSQKTEIIKSSPNLPNNSLKKSDISNFPNFKNLDGITIKPTNQSNTNASKNQFQESKNDNSKDNETDEEWHEENDKDIKLDAKIAHRVNNSIQLNVQSKHSPKTMQKESSKSAFNYDHNSQSSADLLKHLKNVTAKPVNASSQKVPTPRCSPGALKKSALPKTVVQKEISEDGTEIFSIDDSDSDEGHCAKSTTAIKTEEKMETHKSVIALKNLNKNTTKPIIQQNQILKNKNAEKYSNKVANDEEEWDECDEKETVIESNTKFNSPKPNQKNLAINNVLKNLSRNITVKSRNSSPSLSVQSQEYNSRDSHLDANDADSDSDAPLSRVKITEMNNMSDDELSEDHEESDNLENNVKIEHPDDLHSGHDDEQTDEDLDNMEDIESQIAASKVQKDNTWSNSNLNSLKNLNKNLTIKTASNKAVAIREQEKCPTDEIPLFAKNLSNQISIKQVKKPDNNNVEDAVARSMNQSTVSQKMATSSNQVNTFNKEVKTVKTFQTQTKTVIQEITTTVTKTIKTVNQSTKQDVRNVAQSSSGSMITQNIQGLNTNLSQKNYQGVKVRQSAPCIRPKIRGQAPQTTRPAICAPPQIRPAINAQSAVKANQLVPARPRLSGPRPRMPNVTNVRPPSSGQQRPQMRPVKVSPRAVYTPPKKSVETPGHFSCFKKPKESLIPEPDFSTMNKTDEDSSMQFSSTMQMSKSNVCSTSKMLKGNSVVTSTQMKSEMSTSSQQLSKLRGMSGLVVKTSQSQAKQTQVEEKSEMSTSKRNALEAIQKLQSQGLLVKKPRLDVSEDSDHSQHGSDDMEHYSNEEYDE